MALPYMKASCIGLQGLSKAFILRTDYACGNETMYKAEIEKTENNPHIIDIDIYDGNT